MWNILLAHAISVVAANRNNTELNTQLAVRRGTLARVTFSPSSSRESGGERELKSVV